MLYVSYNYFIVILVQTILIITTLTHGVIILFL